MNATADDVRITQWRLDLWRSRLGCELAWLLGVRGRPPLHALDRGVGANGALIGSSNESVKSV